MAKRQPAGEKVLGEKALTAVVAVAACADASLFVAGGRVYGLGAGVAPHTRGGAVFSTGVAEVATDGLNYAYVRDRAGDVHELDAARLKEATDDAFDAFQGGHGFSIGALAEPSRRPWPVARVRDLRKLAG